MSLRKKLVRLRAAIEAQAELTVEILDQALAELDAVEQLEEADAEAPRRACPECAGRELEDTSPMGPEGSPRRLTCLNCGKSFHVGKDFIMETRGGSNG